MKICCENLTFILQGRTILDIPRLDLQGGHVTAILGPNGAGKTTLLRMIAGLQKPTAGRVILGEPDSSPVPARDVAFAFQEAVFLRTTMKRNLELGLGLRGVPSSQRAERVRTTADDFGVGHLLGRYPRELSGGELQRFNFARALCLQAPVTLFDEPLSGIDGAAKERLINELPGLLRRVARTVLLVTHDRYEAFRLADDIVVLMDGRVRAVGPKGEVFRNPPDTDVARLLAYTVLPWQDGAVGVPPGGLHSGAGKFSFDLRVDQVVDLGSHREALGNVGSARVSLPLAPEDPAPRPGETLSIGAESAVYLSRSLEIEGEAR